MWIFFIPLLVIFVSYIYSTLTKSTGSFYEDNSFDAFIDKDSNTESNLGNVKQKSSHSKYTVEYTTEGKQILILYGTEYGFSEEVAKHLFDRICEHQSLDPLIQPRLVNASKYECLDLMREQVCLLLISTSGDGVPPTDARPFYDYIMSATIDLHHLRFSVLAMGDSNYPQFCKTGRSLESRLLQMGGKSIIPRQDVDMEDWSAIYSWISKFINFLTSADLRVNLDYLRLKQEEEGYNRHRPFMATLKVKRLLTSYQGPGDKETIHCELDITGSGLTWTSGDAVGIYPQNNKSEVDWLLKCMKCQDSDPVQIPDWAYKEDENQLEKQINLRQALMTYYDLKNVKTDLLLALQDNLKASKQKIRLSELLREGVSKANCELKEYLSGKEVADVLEEYDSHTLPHHQILSCMKPLQPRYYSISSSPLIDKNTVCVTAAVVRYELLGIPRTGVTTTFLQDRLEVGERCPVFMSRNPDFRLPADHRIPVILIGPGTGIAPFRAFVQERALHKQDCGEVHLYFGCRHRDNDYLYSQELETWKKEELISLHVAFSREQERKVYVQHLLVHDEAIIWKLINQFT
ncbi:hypothetical protein CHS0354_015485 [Potamilus streckersoni]|uniref:Uncharacterized protein n=1 Tax=Potamilus streckersoni TaxID=2493646 RepID=A0AAE0SEL1_9BIVA|nr:hypothetical protein CHS0354_015485 [Potamilus streckersoni]